jgi:hypothetical protein
VSDGGVSKRDVGDEWLNVGEAIAASGGVSNVADSDLTWKLGEIKTTENIRDKSEPLVNVEVRISSTISINRYNARALLSAMLLSVEAEVGKVRGLWVIPDRHQTAFIMKLIGGKHWLRSKYLF